MNQILEYQLLIERRTCRNRGAVYQGGFSLIELLLVLVILAVLAAVVIPKFTGRSEQAKVNAAGSDIHAIELAMDAFEIDNGRFPTNDEGIRALYERPNDADSWHQYLKRGMPVDPWANDYIYVYPGRYNEEGYDLYSLGPDEQEGTEDDVINWSLDDR